jgi:hypothetical protein
MKGFSGFQRAKRASAIHDLPAWHFLNIQIFALTFI